MLSFLQMENVITKWLDIKLLLMLQANDTLVFKILQKYIIQLIL